MLLSVHMSLFQYYQYHFHRSNKVGRVPATKLNPTPARISSNKLTYRGAPHQSHAAGTTITSKAPSPRLHNYGLSTIFFGPFKLQAWFPWQDRQSWRWVLVYLVRDVSPAELLQLQISVALI
ncbi:hypothetical protein BV22DRAFT_180917 [Leucogyrophana mollusca]|uniref:Uncharacterized protein n=1 Tax=Leucogyrophana mollusca TaxID=85980 RepID=A0ACB8BS63_9AGAM|nr:hypothetical protein BV22DRAFT_180917 [Leucogyrophana mollusca]